MSKRINVNPDHYKVAGRERPGNAVAKAPKQLGDDARSRARWQRSQQRAAGQKSRGNQPGRRGR
jgi:hypothetical protein